MYVTSRLRLHGLVTYQLTRFTIEDGAAVIKNLVAWSSLLSKLYWIRQSCWTNLRKCQQKTLKGFSRAQITFFCTFPIPHLSSWIKDVGIYISQCREDTPCKFNLRDSRKDTPFTSLPSVKYEMPLVKYDTIHATYRTNIFVSGIYELGLDFFEYGFSICGFFFHVLLMSWHNMIKRSG